MSSLPTPDDCGTDTLTRRQALADPVVRILLASWRGAGVRLSADDVQLLAMDDAIDTRAHVVLERAGLTTEVVGDRLRVVRLT